MATLTVVDGTIASGIVHRPDLLATTACPTTIVFKMPIAALASMYLPLTALE